MIRQADDKGVSSHTQRYVSRKYFICSSDWLVQRERPLNTPDFFQTLPESSCKARHLLMRPGECSRVFWKAVGLGAMGSCWCLDGSPSGYIRSS